MNAIGGTIPWPKDEAAQSGRRSNEARPWLVVHDPSGDFENSAFRLVDLLYSQEWPEGIIFWNRGSGEIRVWRAGRYRRLAPMPNKKRGKK
jgi:hypothetical protein